MAQIATALPALGGVIRHERLRACPRAASPSRRAHRGPGGPRELLIRAHRPDADRVCMAAQDSGIGIDPAHLDRPFHAFFTTKPGGMGMGLSISRSIIEAHSGRLWSSRHVGPGATVQFTLPLHRAQQA